MISRIEEGGLNLQDLDCKIKATKINWIRKLADHEHKAPWKTNIEQHFKTNIEDIVKHNLVMADYPGFKDKFYTEMWHTWSEINFREPNGIEQICRQRICNNSNIKVDCRPINNPEWTNNDMTFIKDIISEKGTILTETNINRKYNIRLKNLQYNSLISAIPQKWKKS
jgi:hypothetical protein